MLLTQQPYRDPKLRLADLAALVDVPPHRLSQVISASGHTNFADFINRYRIEEFKRLAQAESYQQFTVLALAYEAGFNSKTTFHTAVKKATGLTPGRLRQQVAGTA